MTIPMLCYFYFYECLFLPEWNISAWWKAYTHFYQKHLPDCMD